MIKKVKRIFDEIESWSELDRLSLLVAVLEKEIGFGDHSSKLKNEIAAAVGRLRMEKGIEDSPCPKCEIGGDTFGNGNCMYCEDKSDEEITEMKKRIVKAQQEFRKNTGKTTQQDKKR